MARDASITLIEPLQRVEGFGFASVVLLAWEFMSMEDSVELTWHVAFEDGLLRPVGHDPPTAGFFMG